MTTPLRWLLIASHVPAGGAHGGMVRYTVEIARALAAMPEIELHILSNAEAVDFWASEIVPASQVYGLWKSPTAVQSLLERNAIGSKAFSDSFDVIHGTKHLLPRRGTATKLLAVHDMLALDRPGDFGLAKRFLLPRPYLKSIAEADVIVTNSAATADRVLSYVPSARDRTTVVLLANESLDEPDSETTENPELPDLVGQPFALVVGDLSLRKNLPLVVDAWPRVREQIPDALLAVVGPPSWGDGAIQSDDELDPGVKILGRIDDDSLRWAYTNARVVLCPSLLEGYGLPSVEGLQAGTPVITSDDPALCEASGDAALHVSSLAPDQWVSAIVDALDNPRRVTPPPERSWREVAAETVAAVINHRQGANRES